MEWHSAVCGEPRWLQVSALHAEALKAKVEGFRKQGVALDCFGIGWDGFNDDLLEQLSRNGDGRYGYINAPEEAATEFAAQLAGALAIAAGCALALGLLAPGSKPAADRG